MTVVSYSLRRCPFCKDIRKFYGLRCKTCRRRIPKAEAELYPALDSNRCAKCKALVAATVDGLCGICAERLEFEDRRRSGTLSSRDKTALIYLERAERRKLAEGRPITRTKAARAQDPDNSGDGGRKSSAVSVSDQVRQVRR